MNKEHILILVRLWLFILFIGLTVFIYFKYGKQIISFIRDPKELEIFFNSLAHFSIPVFILLQTIQVIIALMPGEVTQLAGGYIFGMWHGTLISLVGIFIGTVIVFFISRLLGYPVLKKYLKPGRLEEWQKLLQSERAGLIVFLLFLFPALPKSFITYAAGISPIPWYIFFPLAMLGRFPGVFISSIIGANVYEGNYMQAGIITLMITILFVLILLCRKQIINYCKQKLERPVETIHKMK
jgi:uncharacterized membrane protein YdjX (TVP38/TMEM64 family)